MKEVYKAAKVDGLWDDDSDETNKTANVDRCSMLEGEMGEIFI